MTASEAYTELKNNRPSRVFGYEAYCDAYSIALKALRRQIPQDRVQKEKGCKACPGCGRDIWYFQKFCENCGQRLNWSKA